jgi:hypothetical protein
MLKRKCPLCQVLQGVCSTESESTSIAKRISCLGADLQVIGFCIEGKHSDINLKFKREDKCYRNNKAIEHRMNPPATYNIRFKYCPVKLRLFAATASGAAAGASASSALACAARGARGQGVPALTWRAALHRAAPFRTPPRACHVSRACAHALASPSTVAACRARGAARR